MTQTLWHLNSKSQSGLVLRDEIVSAAFLAGYLREQPRGARRFVIATPLRANPLDPYRTPGVRLLQPAGAPPRFLPFSGPLTESERLSSDEPVVDVCPNCQQDACSGCLGHSGFGQSMAALDAEMRLCLWQDRLNRRAKREQRIAASTVDILAGAAR